jgi:hypothetical protein
MYGRSWSPAKAVRSIGQAAAQAPDGFFGSPGVAFTSDLVAAGISVFMGIGATKRNSEAALFWWAATTAAVVKGLHDLKRLG